MAEKRDHLAKMNAAKLGDALTDAETRAVIEHQGGRSLFLIEAVHGPVTIDVDGTRSINLLPGVIVRVPDEHSKPVRDLLRSLAVGGPQALDFEDAGDAFVPPTSDAIKGVQEAADSAAADAADPEAPLPAGEPESDGSEAQEVQGEDGPWPGDDGYEAPGPEAATDDVATARAKRARDKAAEG